MTLLRAEPRCCRCPDAVCDSEGATGWGDHDRPAPTGIGTRFQAIPVRSPNHERKRRSYAGRGPCSGRALLALEGRDGSEASASGP